MIYYKTEEEIELLRENNRMVGQTLAEVGKWLEPGVSTLKLDKIGEEFIRDHGAEPGFKGYEGFPGALCISVNEEVVHGIPSSEKILKDGDIVSIDCGVYKNEYNGDCAFTFPVGEVREDVRSLMQATREALNKGIEQAIAGNRVGDIGFAVQKQIQQYGFSIVREMVGHGVGKSLHEEPQVPNYGKRGRGTQLKSGLVIAIEPMVNLGKRKIYQANDGWTIITSDQKPSAHYEHSIAVTKDGADILSTFEFVDEVLAKK